MLWNKTRLAKRRKKVKYKFGFIFGIPDASETAIGCDVIDFIGLCRWSIFIGDLSIFVVVAAGDGTVAGYTNKFVCFGDGFHIVRFWYRIFVILQYGTFALLWLLYIKCLQQQQQKQKKKKTQPPAKRKRKKCGAHK